MCRSLLLLLLLPLVGCLAAKNAASKVVCRDEDGAPVDWFYLYKLPRIHSQYGAKRNSSGFNYLYISSNNYDAWRLSTHEVTSTASMPGKLLQPLFDDERVLIVAYNDQKPNSNSSTPKAHAKGLLATDGESAVWLVHSVPRYPDIPVYKYPLTGGRYGQSFLCMSLLASEVDKVATQLRLMVPLIYYTRTPEAVLSHFPVLQQVVQGKWQKEAPFQNKVKLETVTGTKFKSFAKSGKEVTELYEDVIAPALDVNLLVETWRNGGGNLATNCTKSDKVFNIEEIKEQALQISFTTNSDHSKWAVSQESGFKLWRWRVGGADWICVGDINRQHDQLVRGGGSVCQKNSKVAQLYRQLIQGYEPCPRDANAKNRKG
ncbi:PREDICTED: deoxyribonuclease-2-alpha [Rhagoletis zephyria]|uniref:deoxyribonuclease-2-alpha n=1 Tax=Rhagoletis zephyria TaxID=28612 RepID=UPI0008114FA4|nr:PREDICTED: deoxyribonuclease-2-alpha [Rhagoletis zephyria]XP_017470885.1 PREDICTED: deoxyribonuclease-2-alpha [Rhagoletis zephyria]XP_017470886.1 PREDICTED: deoxyribonuclease-2-alpha [Rhagoletis zephyria]XP_017470887.1 PREDICTED: deoxyribonuclease-2-alpha [Rhagoletis zephyria]XP_017470889.1 PREDICTED: deoxyribonuclease-2-alpha [Rhagoletis zephyria]